MSPFSWSHHWVWLVPLSVHLGYRGIVLGSRRAVGAMWLLCALTAGWLIFPQGKAPTSGLVAWRPGGTLEYVAAQRLSVCAADSSNRVGGLAAGRRIRFSCHCGRRVFDGSAGQHCQPGACGRRWRSLITSMTRHRVSLSRARSPAVLVCPRGFHGGLLVLRVVTSLRSRPPVYQPRQVHRSCAGSPATAPAAPWSGSHR